MPVSFRAKRNVIEHKAEPRQDNRRIAIEPTTIKISVSMTQAMLAITFAKKSLGKSGNIGVIVQHDVQAGALFDVADNLETVPTDQIGRKSRRAV